MRRSAGDYNSKTCREESKKLFVKISNIDEGGNFDSEKKRWDDPIIKRCIGKVVTVAGRCIRESVYDDGTPALHKATTRKWAKGKKPLEKWWVDFEDGSSVGKQISTNKIYYYDIEKSIFKISYNYEFNIIG